MHLVPQSLVVSGKTVTEKEVSEFFFHILHQAVLGPHRVGRNVHGLHFTFIRFAFIGSIRYGHSCIVEYSPRNSLGLARRRRRAKTIRNGHHDVKEAKSEKKKTWMTLQKYQRRPEFPTYLTTPFAPDTNTNHGTRCSEPKAKQLLHK